MNITQQQLSDGKIQLTIVIPPDKYEKYLRGQALEMAEKINLSGFRPGKAPYDVIKKQVGEMALLTDALNQIVAHTYPQAVLEQKLRPAMPPKIEVLKAAPGNPVEYRAEVVILPSVELPDLGSIKVKQRPIKVTDEQTAEALEELRKMRASEALTDGPAAVGDKVELDIKTSVPDKPEAGEHVKNQTIVLGETKLIDGFAENIIGLKAGHEKSFKQKFPAKYHQPNYAGKEVDVAIKVSKVWQINLPELNDGFARGVNQKFKNLADLKAQLTANLKQEKEYQAAQRQEQEMLDKLVKETKFGEIAAELLADVQAKLLDDMRFNIERSGGKWEDYLKTVKKTADELKAEMAPSAAKRIKIDCIIAEVMEAQKIEVEKSRIDDEINKLLGQFPSVEDAKKKIDLHRLRMSIRGRLLTQRVFEWLKKQVKFE